MPTRAPSPCQAFQAIAFDFDGTLVNTLHLHYEAYKAVFEAIHIDLTPDDFYQNIGGKAAEAIPLFLRGRRTDLTIAEIHSRKKERIAELFRTAPLQILPTARFLPVFAGHLPMALVSAGSRPGILQLLGRLGWDGYFAVIITGEDTQASKPDPAPYLLAAVRLGVDPATMAAFEDTQAGIESAVAAGMSVFDVTGNVNLPLP